MHPDPGLALRALNSSAYSKGKEVHSATIRAAKVKSSSVEIPPHVLHRSFGYGGSQMLQGGSQSMPLKKIQMSAACLAVSPLYLWSSVRQGSELFELSI